MSRTRIEHDAMGPIHVNENAMWGAQTERSRQYFNIGSERMPEALIRAMILVKRTAAHVHEAKGVLPSATTQLIMKACDELLKNFDQYRDQFPLKVWQTGSGTQSHMNVNEVIANIANVSVGSSLGAKSPIHPNDHVNYGQSSNDSVPTAMHIAVVVAVHDHLLPALSKLWRALDQKAKEFSHILKVARTHMQDATPMTVGQEWSAFARQIELSIERIHTSLDGVCSLAQGGTAVGTGINSYKGFSDAFVTELNKHFNGTHVFRASLNTFEALSSHDALVYFSGALNTVAVSLMKMGNDIRMLGSGPRAGLGELLLPENEPGSSIMPGKVNPTQVEALTMVAAHVMGLHHAVSIGGSQGHFQLNVFKPMIAHNILSSIQLLSDVMHSFSDFCIRDMSVNEVRVHDNIEHCLMCATALNPYIGYDKASAIVKKAHKESLSLREAAMALDVLTEAEYHKYMNYEAMTHPS